jgi:hypothetical protein
MTPLSPATYGYFSFPTWTLIISSQWVPRSASNSDPVSSRGCPVLVPPRVLREAELAVVGQPSRMAEDRIHEMARDGADIEERALTVPHADVRNGTHHLGNISSKSGGISVSIARIGAHADVRHNSVLAQLNHSKAWIIVINVNSNSDQ